MGPLETKTVEFGKHVIVVRETTGADELMAVKILSKELDKKGEETAQGMQQIAVMMVLSILEIDGVKQPVPQTYEEVVRTLAAFKSREMAKVREAFLELNGGDDFLPEQTT